MQLHFPASFARARIVSIAIAMVAAAIGAAANAGANAEGAAAKGPVEVTATQLLDEIRTGCGGGVTGGASGLVLKRNGELSSWRRSGSAAMQSIVLGKDATAAERLFRRASKRGFQKLSFNGAGNLTCWIEQEQGGVVHRVQWGDPAQAPPLAAELYEAVRNLQRKLSGPAAPH